MTLSYAGYSWSFNHHMGRVNPREIFALLDAAYRFRQYPNYRMLVNQALVSEEIFTPNVRSDSGQVDAWRDYQQILPELGLIYSTRYIKQPQLTPIGLMYIDCPGKNATARQNTPTSRDTGAFRGEAHGTFLQPYR